MLNDLNANDSCRVTFRSVDCRLPAPDSSSAQIARRGKSPWRSGLDCVDHAKKRLNFTFNKRRRFPFGPRESLGLTSRGRIHGRNSLIGSRFKSRQNYPHLRKFSLFAHLEQDIAPRNGEYLPRLTKPKRRLATTDTIEMHKTNDAWVRREQGLDREKKRALPGALRNFVNETGIGHSEIARELGIRPGTILGWMHGTIELRGATLIAIKCFLETNRPAYLRADQQNNQADREQTKWQSFLQYPQ